MRPMLATATPDPGRLPAGPGWTYEVKWDGMRVLADVTHRPVSADGIEPTGAVRLTSRTGTDVTVTFPELRALVSLPDTMLDGEVVAFDDAGLPSFPVLAERLHVRQAISARSWARRLPVTYMVFDVLRLHGEDLAWRPLAQRRALLEELALPGPARLSPWYSDGADLLSATREQGLEGVVAKRLDAPYEPGRRSPTWVKSAHRPERTVLVGGWRPQTDTTSSAPMLLVGAPTAGGGLRYLGRVGSGIGHRAQVDLGRVLGALTARRAPFDDPVPAMDAKGATWVEPLVAVQVRHLGWTSGGRLRQPSFHGIRRDASADVWEPA